MTRPARVALRAAVVLALLVPAPASALAAGWSRPFRYAGPFSADLSAPELAQSPSGQSAVAFAVQDEDQPWVSQATVVLRAGGGRLTRLRVPGAKQVLSLAYAGNTLELVSATVSAGPGCCGAAHATTLSGRRFSPRRTLLPGLLGTVVGSLLVLPGSRTLAALAGEREVWAGPFGGPMQRLSGSSSWPQALAATTFGRGRALIAWSSAAGITDQAAAVDVASGAVKHPLLGTRTEIRMQPGYSVDELAAAPGAGAGTLAWIQSWNDQSGAYHSEVVVVDFAGSLQARAFEIPGQIAGGLSLAGDGAGDQVLAFRGCDRFGNCNLYALAKRARGHYGQPQQLGTIDPGEAPATAVSTRGTALVGWIDQGHVLFAGGRSGLGAPTVVSATNYGADLTVAAGAGGRASAAWTQGTLAPSVMGAVYSP